MDVLNRRTLQERIPFRSINDILSVEGFACKLKGMQIFLGFGCGHKDVVDIKNKWQRMQWHAVVTKKQSHGRPVHSARSQVC